MVVRKSSHLILTGEDPGRSMGTNETLGEPGFLLVSLLLYTRAVSTESLTVTFILAAQLSPAQLFRIYYKHCSKK